MKKKIEVGKKLCDILSDTTYIEVTASVRYGTCHIWH